jgi:hypothetical protein
MQQYIVMALAAGMAVAAACGGGSSDGGVTPIELGVPKDQIPSPGLCRVWVSGGRISQQPLARSCDDIEWAAPLGALVLYRPDDGSREVHVKYMSRNTPGFVTGIDAFDIDTLRLLRVIQAYTKETVDTMMSGAERTR